MSAPLTPPKLAQKLLLWFLKPPLAEEVLGDLDEQYDRMHALHSPSRARRNYWFQVLQYLRPFAIRRFRFFSSNPNTMQQHHFKVAWRHIRRYRGSFALNFLGLASGLASAFLIFLWVVDEYRVDRFHEQEGQLYQVFLKIDRGTEELTMPYTPAPLAPMLTETFPEIEEAILYQLSWDDQDVLKTDERQIISHGIYTTGSFFDAFSYPILSQVQDSLLPDRLSALLSESVARKLFPGEDALGKSFDGPEGATYHVAGIFADLPKHSSHSFDVVFHWEQFLKHHPWLAAWHNQDPYTYLVLRPETDHKALEAKLTPFLQQHAEKTTQSLLVQPFEDGYLYGSYEEDSPTGGRIAYVRSFSAIGLAVLLIACINFMNLSTARASRRMREIGVKKAMGVQRRSLMWQFLTESLLITLLSFLGSLLLIGLALPLFNQLTGKTLSFPWQPAILAAMVGIAVLTSLLAGSYPALYLSRFKPLQVLKGTRPNDPSESWVRKGLVVMQFGLSVVFIALVLIINQQMNFVKNKNLGYSRDHAFYFTHDVNLNEGNVYQDYLGRLRQSGHIQGAASYFHNLTGDHGGTEGLVWPGKDPEEPLNIANLEVGPGYVEAFGIELLEGETITDMSGNDRQLLLNETAVEMMGLEDPVGTRVTLWNVERTIVGVVKDFHFSGLHNAIGPAMIRTYSDFPKTLIKAQPGQMVEAMAFVREQHEKVSPGYPVEFGFVDDDYARLYAAEERTGKLAEIFGGIAILISCLGLLGLAAYNGERRAKEVGIRKVLGATSFQLVSLLSAEYTKTVGLGILLALPLCYFIGTQWLAQFAFHIPFSWVHLLIAGGAALLLAWLTVGSHTLRTTRKNPTVVFKQD
ncbi:MAG: FtsX-like permease family protein [Bacteroidota bacterium]